MLVSGRVAEIFQAHRSPITEKIPDPRTVLEEQRRANGSVIPNGSEVEEKIFEMNATHMETMKKLQALFFFKSKDHDFSWMDQIKLDANIPGSSFCA